MKFKLLIILVLSLSFLSACKSDKEKIAERKKEYDFSINQVIKLENEKLKSEDKHGIKRSETGIVVFNNGDLIRLYYSYDSKKVNVIYQKKKDKYVLLPENKNTFEKIDNAKENYIENLGRK